MSELLNQVLKVVDGIAEITPSFARQKDKGEPKIVGHRGGYGPGFGENSIDSLAACAKLGVWSVEFDVRWTKDHVPIVLHDETAWRTFKVQTPPVQNLTWEELKSRVPAIPRLEEIVQTIGKTCHLMIEVKAPLAGANLDSFKAALKPLEPMKDYHLLTLDPQFLIDEIGFPKSCRVLVTEFHPLEGSKFILENGWGGIAGHYLLLTPGLRRKHHRQGQLIGVGYVNGLNNLYRQQRLGADWIFSNRAVELMQNLRADLDGSPQLK